MSKNKEQSIVEDYLDLQRKYEQQYGERTVVLMMVGTFYETYEYDPTCCANEKAKLNSKGVPQLEPTGHSVELSTLLNFVLTQEKPDDPYTYLNPWKVGFPVVAYEKCKRTLLFSDYVIVLVDQTGNKLPNGKAERFVNEIISPTMQLDSITLNRATSNIACIYIEYHQGMNPIRNHYENFVITTGAAVIDVITGNNRVCEFYSKLEDQVHAVQELYRFLITHSPRELIVHISDMPDGLNKHSAEAPNPYVKYLERTLELRRFDRLNVHVNTMSLEYKKIPYQIEVLNKLFTKQVNGLSIIQRRNEKIIEELGLERMNYGRIAYMLLMQHCYSHNTDIISRLSKPDLQWIDENKHLILTHNAIVQLNLVSSNEKSNKSRKEIDSLMSVLDHNRTHLGRRVLHNILQNPMLDPVEINTYYDMVDEMLLPTENPLYSILDPLLRELPDIGRLQRKLEIKLITPKEMAVLYRAYLKIINIYVTVMNTKSPVLNKQMLNQEDVDSFNNFIARFSAIINFEALECCNIDTSVESKNKWLEFVDCPIKEGYFPDLDEQNKILVNAELLLQQIVDHLNGFLMGTTGKKIEFKAAKKKRGATKQDPTGTVLTTTAAKANTLMKSGVNIELCGQIQIVAYTAADKMIVSDKITHLCNTIDQCKMWLRVKLLSIYGLILEEMTSKYTFYVPIAACVGKLDLIHSYAKAASLYRYSRPVIMPDNSLGSYITAKEFRHPIGERVIDGAYVTNDISLGNGNSEGIDRSMGMTLFGVNSSGKSTLAKGIATIVIMAQCGCFVPGNIELTAYHKIITQLMVDDDIFKGESSFIKEMSGIRTMMRQADKNTLVIGDELSSNTDTSSATAITVSSILLLIDAKTSFIFATHLHEMLNLPCMKNISSDKLAINHLAIDYDETTKDIIYNRKLQKGSGLSTYGLLVAKSLGMPDSFMELAYDILKEVTNEKKNLVEPAHSNYNNKVYVDLCAKCGKDRTQKDLHVHHIIEQKHSDNKGVIMGVIERDDGSLTDVGITNKNSKDNLVVLCRDCHIAIHNNKMELETLTVPNGKIIKVCTN